MVCVSVSIWLLILWLWNGDENELWPAPAPSHSQDGPVSVIPGGFFMEAARFRGGISMGISGWGLSWGLSWGSGDRMWIEKDHDDGMGRAKWCNSAANCVMIWGTI